MKPPRQNSGMVCLKDLLNFKGIVLIILRGVKTRLIRSMLVNWRPGRFYFLFLSDTFTREA
jgi:hypothetical protein